MRVYNPANTYSDALNAELDLLGGMEVAYFVDPKGKQVGKMVVAKVGEKIEGVLFIKGDKKFPNLASRVEIAPLDGEFLEDRVYIALFKKIAVGMQEYYGITLGKMPWGESFLEPLSEAGWKVYW